MSETNDQAHLTAVATPPPDPEINPEYEHLDADRGDLRDAIATEQDELDALNNGGA